MATERIRQEGVSFIEKVSGFLMGITHQKGPINSLSQVRSRVALINGAQTSIDMTSAYAALLDKDTLAALKSAGVPVSVGPSLRISIMLVDHQHVASLIPVPGDGKIGEVEQYIVKNYKYARRSLLKITGAQKVFDSINSLPIPSSPQP